MSLAPWAEAAAQHGGFSGNGVDTSERVVCVAAQCNPRTGPARISPCGSGKRRNAERHVAIVRRRNTEIPRAKPQSREDRQDEANSEAVDHATDAVSDQGDIEVDQQAQATRGEAEV